MNNEDTKKDRLKSKGKSEFIKLIETYGGACSIDSVHNYINYTSDEAYQMISDGEILSYEHNGDVRLPLFQFEINCFEVIQTILVRVIKSTSKISQILFFLNYDQDLGMTPIEAIRTGQHSKLDLVMILAKQFQQQIAR